MQSLLSRVPHFLIRFGPYVAKSLLFSSIGFAVMPAAVEAVTITVDSQSYDIAVNNISYVSAPSFFQSPPSGLMAWWGDSTGDRAVAFAKEVYDQLGAGPNAGYGPVFAYEINGGLLSAILQDLSNPQFQQDAFFNDNLILSYAVATPLSNPGVPGPLPLLTVAAAGAWSRRLRKRVCAASGKRSLYSVLVPYRSVLLSTTSAPNS